MVESHGPLRILAGEASSSLVDHQFDILRSITQEDQKYASLSARGINTYEAPMGSRSKRPYSVVVGGGKKPTIGHLN